MYTILTVLVLINTALAIPSNNMLQDRNAVPFWGGYALAYSGSNCPANTVQCVGDVEVPGPGSNIHACCPVGSICVVNGATYCCPDATDCISRIQTETVCANTAWDLYNSTAQNGPFCCQAGETPISDPSAQWGECWAPGSPIVSSEIASSLPQVPVTFLPLSGATSATGTVTATAPSKTTTGTSTAPDKTSSAVAAAVSDVSKVTLSRNAIIGIAVGGFVFVVLALVLCGCCCCRIRRSRQNRKLEVNPY